MPEFEQEIAAELEIDVPGLQEAVAKHLTPVEVILGESLLTPGLQTFVRCHSYAHSLPIKDYDSFKGKSVNIRITRPILKRYGINDTLRVRQTIYRCSERKPFDPNNEQFVLAACDPSLLEDAASLVSKSWKCTPPHNVVSEVLRQCAGVSRMDIESCEPARDYVAENIHPFQVVAQQCNVALADGNDPSFVHYMTFGDVVQNSNSSGIHHFRSLNSLVKQNPTMEYHYSEAPEKYGVPSNILQYVFPCDFDLLSDILNGVDASGKDINSATIYNPLTNMYSLFGSQTFGCGIGSGNIKNAMSNNGSEALQDACPDYSYLYIQKRQARMGLLEQDKIALRLTVPWNPELHAGKVVLVYFQNKSDTTLYNYGSGYYLISALTHKIKRGGLATTTIDCVSTSVGNGVQ